MPSWPAEHEAREIFNEIFSRLKEDYPTKEQLPWKLLLAVTILGGDVNAVTGIVRELVFVALQEQYGYSGEGLAHVDVECWRIDEFSLQDRRCLLVGVKDPQWKNFGIILTFQEFNLSSS